MRSEPNSARAVAASVVLADTGLRRRELGHLDRKRRSLDVAKATVTKTKNRQRSSPSLALETSTQLARHKLDAAGS